MTSHTHYLWFTTKRRQEIIDVTDEVVEQVRASGVQEGFVLVSAMHITASVFVNDHESGLWADILKWLDETIAPWEPGRYRHNETGEDNAAAHLRSLTIGHEVIVPITAGKLDLGPWQRVFYGEWDGQRRKRVVIKVLGDTTGAFSLARSAARSWLDRSDSTRPSRSQSSSHVPTTVYETPACSVKVNDSDSSVSSVPTRGANDRTAPLVPSDAVARSSWART